ncbi:MAG: TraB/GumN family protein [Flavisolibacter sp.]
MRTLIAAVLLCSVISSYSQKTKVPPKHYPSLLWEITGKGLTKPSYLFGTMHVSSKMVFHLSDSFYLGIKNADVVALETDMGSWQEDFSKYELNPIEGFSFYNSYRKGFGQPSDYLTIASLKFSPYEKLIEAALYNNPSILNNFLYRSYSEKSSDFEEDTYLDLHIYQAGKKWGKKVCGVENFDESMQLMKEAYMDAAKEKDKKERSFDYDGDFSYGKLEDAYRTGNLDLLDTINKVNSSSAAFDEKFLYKRNEIQANSIDSIIRTKASLFVGVGAAHLPGQRGVIEMLRRKGYKLRPIKMTERDSKHKDEVEKIRVPVQFTKQSSPDGFYSVNMPGKLYDFSSVYGISQQLQFADMTNGSYYMVTRINTNTILWGHDEEIVLRKIDSVMYENIPGKILTRQNIVKTGYKGIEVINRTRRGDFQRYNIFVTPFEIILFKMSGNAEYVKEGKEADQFFNSIELKTYNTSWKKWSPQFGGFEIDFPHEPVISHEIDWQFMARDKQSGTGLELIRTDVHNYDFVEEDSFDLGLMEESFASSEFIEKQLSRKQTKQGIYPALEAKYKYKDGSVALVKFIIQGAHYYTLVAHAKKENEKMSQFINSFKITPFIYGPSKKHTDTSLFFTVTSPVPLEKDKKLSMLPDNMPGMGGLEEDDSILEERISYKDRLVVSDSTGEKIYVSFNRPSRYHFDDDSTINFLDSTHIKTYKQNWKFRNKKSFILPNKTKVDEYVLGDPKSSRYIRVKEFSREGIYHKLETQGDTLTKQSVFITQFFETFNPIDTLNSFDVKSKKTALFFSDFFSKDSLLHKKAVKNIDMLEFDSVDFPQLKKIIQALNWKEKKYMDVKKDFVWKLSTIDSEQVSDYLKQIYFAAGDTIELQYTALETLLSQRTAYAYKVFKDIMVTEPPVLEVDNNNTNYNPYGRRSYNPYADFVYTDHSRSYGQQQRSGSFLDNLTDTLLLTKGIFKDLLPLININDYEQPIMNLMGTMIDSSLLTSADYETYQSKFLIEAKQQLKKQVISEKNKSIEKAQEDDEDKNIYRDTDNQDLGNTQLSLYATLLMPFWDKNPAVPQLINQLLSSKDKRLKYNTTMLLLRHKKQVQDTMLTFFAKMDEYRYDLYTDLKDENMLNLFPLAYMNQTDLAKSKLLSMTSSYEKPDSIVFIDKITVQQNDRKGFVYFFKYKKKKDDSSWNLASVGILPSDPKKFEFEEKEYFEEMKYNFTDISISKIEEDEPLSDQLKKALKKLQYSKRNSAAEFYTEESTAGMDFIQRSFRD